MPGHTRPTGLIGAAAGVAAAAAIGCTLLLPANVNVTLLNGVVLAALALGRMRRWIWPVAIALVAAGYTGLVLAPPPPVEPGQIMYLHWLNRSLSAVMTLTVAAIVRLWVRTEETLEASRNELEERNAALEASNAELLAREEEIARQNEELQSQSEELERQSEELRVANDELASRERMLAKLLDLSRTLATEVRGASVMATICEALTDILSEIATASAILLRQDDVVAVRCHFGFGAEGPRETRLSFEHSFASLVVARGQSGFLHDLSLRPDLRIPQPAQGPPLHSVLGAPLWVRGKAIGTLEAYCDTPHQWTEEQLGLITSMAAQASISLETARLFEEVERARRRFETVFRTLPIGVLVCDDPGCREVSGNPAAAALFTTSLEANFSPFATPGSLVRHTVLREGRALLPEQLPIVRAVRGGEELQGEELDILLPGGRRYTVLISAAPIYDAEGRVTGGVCVIADITARKQLEREIEARRREAEEASLRKTRFLAAVSHDIRTPTNAIRLRAELIKRTASNPALVGRVPELAEELQGSATALVELVGEVLDLTRFDTGRVELQETEFSLGETIAEECRHLAPVAEGRDLRLECAPVEPPLWVRADRIKLARVIGNLIENALKFTESGEVHVSVGLTSDRRVEIRVRDTGSGIPHEHLARIFDEFFQLRNPERDRTKGRGLGLAICKRLVDAMGGEIAVETTPGAGSVFTVTLPAAAVVPRPPAHHVPPHAETSPRDSLAGVRVLVVEDHDSTRRDIADILRAEGAVVSEAADGRAALRAVRDGAPQIVLLDLMLPDLDGTEVLKAIRTDRPGGLVIVIVLTGDSATRQVEELERLGAHAVIQKPVDPVRLLARMRGIVGGEKEDA